MNVSASYPPIAGLRTLLTAWLLCALATMLGGVPVAHANAITVTSKADTPGSPGCMLRDAIIAANTNASSGNCAAGTAGLDTINFSLGQTCAVVVCTIVLTSALPPVSESLTIAGGSNQPTISG